MMAPTFLSVNSETGCTLADLSVSGYDVPELVDPDEGEWEGGCSGGDFVLNFLSSSGTIEVRYYWIDDGETGPGWFASNGGKPIPGGASSVVIASGQGAWVRGAGMKLQSAGAIATSDVAKKTNTAGNTAVGNCMPIDLNLGRLIVTGYDTPELVDPDEGEWDGGCSGGDFVLNFLSSSGTVQSRYYWIDDGETSPGWYATNGGKAIEGGASSVAFNAGQGVWIRGGGMCLNIPAPEL